MRGIILESEGQDRTICVVANNIQFVPMMLGLTLVPVQRYNTSREASLGYFFMEIDLSDTDMKVLAYQERGYFDPGYRVHGDGTNYFTFTILEFDPKKESRLKNKNHFIYKTKIKLLEDSRHDDHNQTGRTLSYSMPHKILLDTLALLNKIQAIKIENGKCIFDPIGLTIKLKAKIQNGNVTYKLLEVTPAKQNTTVESEETSPLIDPLEAFHSKFERAFSKNNTREVIEDRESFTEERLGKLFKLFFNKGNDPNDDIDDAYNAFISLLDHWKIRTPDSLKELERLTREKYPKG